nr:MAG TPA: hypothetical protein [Caudoviricetes sp.]
MTKIVTLYYKFWQRDKHCHVKYTNLITSYFSDFQNHNSLQYNHF